MKICLPLTFFTLAFIGLNLSYGRNENLAMSYCAHPDDGKLRHSFRACERDVSGHPGTLVSDREVIDICADCKKSHSENPNLCKSSTFHCKPKSESSESGSEGYEPNVIHVDRERK